MCFGTYFITALIKQRAKPFSKSSYFQSYIILRNCNHYFGIINFLFCLGEYPELAATSGLHQGHRCLERGVRFLCIQRPPRVCPRQLRIQVSAKKIRKKFLKKSAKNFAKNPQRGFSKKYTSTWAICSNSLPNYFQSIYNIEKYWERIASIEKF